MVGMERLGHGVKRHNGYSRSVPLIRPVKFGLLTSHFGYRVSPFTGNTQMHKGIDIADDLGTPIRATGTGRVSFIGRKGGYGRAVMIDHGYHIDTLYGHVQNILVRKGQIVKRGQIIATIGNTGRSTGPHLHYEVHYKKRAVDPSRYILQNF